MNNLNKTHRQSFQALSFVFALMVLAGCSSVPKYVRPPVEIPAAFKEADHNAQAAQWKTAEPAADQSRGKWWQVFSDETLNALEEQALLANQDLKAGTARLGQARALEQNARSAFYPQIGVGFGPTRERASPASQGLAPDADSKPFTLWRGQAYFSYEADLFGQISASVDAANLDAQKYAALFHSLQLAIQSDVAQAYFLIRELDAESELFANTVSLREQALNLTQHRFNEGDISELDVARAQTELAAAQSEWQGITRQRAIAEHALAILLGTAPSNFTLPAAPISRLAIRVPAGLPSALLERRPDIAAAERSMAAANARIGVARSAFFPQLNITGALGYESNEIGDLFKWSSRSFVLGPLVGTMLTLPLFDGGARQAGVERANAAFDEEVANYRQTILKAFKEVEDNLANLRILDDQSKSQDEAVNYATRAAKLSHLQYQEGLVSYLNVIDADRSVLLQRRIAVQLDGERARSTVNLIRAFGGGWNGYVFAK